jgi:hypothetical protein
MLPVRAATAEEEAVGFQKSWHAEMQENATLRAENERRLSEIESHKTTRRMWQERAESTIAENERLKTALRKNRVAFNALGCALHNDGFVAANDCWRAIDAIDAALNETQEDER